MRRHPPPCPPREGRDDDRAGASVPAVVLDNEDGANAALLAAYDRVQVREVYLTASDPIQVWPPPLLSQPIYIYVWGRPIRPARVPPGVRGPSSRGALLPLPRRAAIRFSRFTRESLLAIPDTSAPKREVVPENLPEFLRALFRLYFTALSEHPSLSAISLIGSRAHHA